MKSPWDNDNFSNKFFNNFNKEFIPNNFFDFRIVIAVVLAVVIFWLLSGIYSVKEGEEAIVTRFGAYNRKAYAGLNYHLPSPLEDVIIEKVNKSRRTEIGYRSYDRSYRYSYNSGEENSDNFKLLPEEANMLTGDENILTLNCEVMWHNKSLKEYIFNVLSPEETIKLAAESAIREVISKTSISSVLSNQKQEIADSIQKLTQEILDNYKIGVEIEKVQLLKAEPPSEVISYYRDVQTAKADKEKEINQAYAYMNDVLPKARGQAAKVLQEAEGYKQEVISRASGDSTRFTLILDEYLKNKQITKDRLYFETLEKVLSGTNKTIVGAETLPHLAVTPKGGN